MKYKYILTGIKREFMRSGVDCDIEASHRVQVRW